MFLSDAVLGFGEVGNPLVSLTRLTIIYLREYIDQKKVSVGSA